MLSQKLAALFALTVFASQGVIGLPSPQVVDADADAAAAIDAVGDLGAVKAYSGALAAINGIRDTVGDVVS